MQNIAIFDVEELKLAVFAQESVVEMSDGSGEPFEDWTIFVMQEKEQKDDPVAISLLDKYNELNAKNQKKFDADVSECEMLLRNSKTDDDESAEYNYSVDKIREHIVLEEMSEFLN